MLQHPSIQLNVFLKLLKRDLTVFFKNSLDNYINTLCWVLLSLLIYQFIMPKMGWIYKGEFLLVSCVISKAFFGVMDNVTNLVADLDSNKTITYDMTLPLSHTLLFIKIALSNAIYTCLLSFFVLPAGKLLLWNYLHFPHFNIYKFIIILFVSSIFSGFFSLYIIGTTKSILNIEDVWSGLLFPLFYLGGFVFTWKIMYEASPFMACLNLLNPVMYMFEGMRSATLDPALSIPFWISVFMLILFSIPAGCIGIHLLKKRLDAI
ncbi:ABC transporter permease [Candidatus Babeliales bacterium]|nr:ABC transporter permease [Candidatus Babeliales bacterium]MBP9843654.1 ABC transporter permease [Candidatus Babeliales bacterium]